ncbi:hypothetical protein PUN4_650021 [Paraburkholderia unamae]|nr:hypothetical protein [Paraburkholderia unamae]CAG9271564.1 hypothetical protein PUN4_650021 [Paraburkholderia unamae]
MSATAVNSLYAMFGTAAQNPKFQQYMEDNGGGVEMMSSLESGQVDY